jgi:hypothetical protein
MALRSLCSADGRFRRLSNCLLLSNLHLPESCGLCSEHGRDGGTNSRSSRSCRQTQAPCAQRFAAAGPPVEFVRTSRQAPARSADSQFRRHSNSLPLNSLLLLESCRLCPKHGPDGGTNSPLFAPLVVLGEMRPPRFESRFHSCSPGRFWLHIEPGLWRKTSPVI